MLVRGRSSNKDYHHYHPLEYSLGRVLPVRRFHFVPYYRTLSHLTWLSSSSPRHHRGWALQWAPQKFPAKPQLCIDEISSKNDKKEDSNSKTKNHKEDKKSEEVKKDKEKTTTKKEKEEEEEEEEEDGEGQTDPREKLWIALAAAVSSGIMATGLLYFTRDMGIEEIDWLTFKSKLLEEGKVRRLAVYKNTNKVYVFTNDESRPSHMFTIADVDSFDRKIEQAQRDLGIEVIDFIPVSYHIDLVRAISPTLAWSIGTIALFGLMFYWMTRLGPGGDIFSMLKSRARRVDKQTGIKTTFKDVAGMDEAKREVMEFVDFLKQPEKYKKLGAKIPKGALLVGPPGTGKTLLAKATAGEAGVPFFSISGSDFIEMFVGVGPSRVRDMFEEARQSAPCIIFIDELDAIGRARSKTGFHNDERENTLNQLLVEMDGFNTEAGVVVLAGTNRPDILDPALLRPGRFDRQIYVDLPDLHGRRDIFKVHLKPLKIEGDMEKIAERLATLTPGFSGAISPPLRTYLLEGADIANVCNEGALIAARHNKKKVNLQDFEAAIERVIGGMERKNRVLSLKEKTTVAYHEAGHATVGWFLKHVDPLLKVSIVPRGVAALGYAQYQPKDQYLYSREELMDRMCMTLGGRIAEAIIFGKISTGARDDLEKVTKMAYAQVAKYGMSPTIGTISYPEREGEFAIEKPFSQATAKKIDQEVRRLVNEAYQKTQALLQEKREGLEKVARRLLEKEVLVREDLQELLGVRPFEEKVTFDQLTNQEDTSAASSSSTSTSPAS